MTIGQRITRVEDLPLITGEAHFVGDLRLPGQLYARIVRSPIAHGRLLDVDVEEARRARGVVGVWTAEDIGHEFGFVPVIGTRVSHRDDVVPYLQPVLAHDRVRYVGEPVALVVAEDRYVAEDAAELVFVDLDPLPVVAEASNALSEEDLFRQGNLITTIEARSGDPESCFAEAEVVVECEFHIGRHSGVPMETRGTLAFYEPESDGIVIYGATKVPHWNRRQLARLLRIDEDRIRMVETAVGGGFGVKGEFYPEDFLVPWAARSLRRSIQWVEDRREHFMATNHSRQQRHAAAIAGTRDGRVLAIRSQFWVDLGAYVRTHGVRVPELTVTMLPGPYRIPHYHGTAHCVVTNKTPTGTYRAPGRFESCFIRERLMDIFAARVGQDPIAIRERNLISRAEIPYRRNLGASVEPMELTEGDHARLVRQVVEAIDVEGVRRRQRRGERVGVGLALFLEKSGVGPGELGSVTVGSDGTILVRSGCSSVGQGLRTVLAQIVADTFQVSVDRVRVELLDTNEVERGTGTFASRSTATAGTAVYQAAQQVVGQARAYVADAFEASADDVVFRNGALEVAGVPERRITLEQVAEARDAGKEGAPVLAASEFFEVTSVTYPYGAHAAVVTADTDTGEPRVEKLVLGFDVGKAVNPMLVEGQLHGGAMQGLAGALYEDFVYDADGNPLATSFMDYLMPTAAESPEMVTVVTEDAPTPTNPLGIKGAGEGGVTGVAAAVASAVDDAMGMPGLVRRVPIHPALLARESARASSSYVGVS